MTTEVNSPSLSNQSSLLYMFNLLLKICGTGLIFTGINLGLFFDQVLLPKYLLNLFKSSSFSNAQVLTATYQSFLVAIFLSFKILFLIIAGTLSDHIKTPIGSRIPIALFGFLLMISFYFIGSLNFILNSSTYYWVLPVIYCMIGIGSAFVTAPGYALVVDLFKQQERGWAGMGIALFSAIGTLLGIIISTFNITPLNDYFILTSVLLFLILVITTSILPKFNSKYPSKNKFFTDLKNTPAYLFNLEKIHEEARGPLTRSDVFLKLLFIQMFMGASVYIIAIYAPLFLVLLNDNNSGYVVGLDPGLALILLGIFGVIFAGPIGIIIKFIGKTRTAMGGTFIFAIGCILMAQTIMWTYNGFVIILMLLGGSSVIVSIMTVALPADKVPESNAGQFMGIFTVASMLILPLITFITAIIFQLILNPFLGFQLLFYSMAVLQIIVIFLLYSLDKHEQSVLQTVLEHPELYNPTVD